MPDESSVLMQKSSALQRDILRTILYFDLFRHPLTVSEIYTFLSSDSTNPFEVVKSCRTAPLNSIVVENNEYYRLQTADPSIVNERLVNERRARYYWKIARLMGGLIRRFPFVRAVFVSGELSKGVASKASDVDFFIVAAEHRLWICRTLLILFKKVFLLNSKKFFCINHFVSEHHLELKDRTVYSAIEVATLKPVYNTELYRDYLNANWWIADFLPNASSSTANLIAKRRRTSFLQRTFELLLPRKFADRLDDWLMEQWRSIWRKRYPDLPEELRNRLFQCTSFVSTAYGEDMLKRVLDCYRRRLQEFGLELREFTPSHAMNHLEMPVD